MISMELTPREVHIILEDRARIKAQEELYTKQAICKHDFSRYVGHDHNNDCYECIHCGTYEWS